MAGLELGNLLGAVTQATTALSKEKNLKSFIETINKFGVQVKNNFEVNFSGLQDMTFFVSNIDVSGGMKQNFTQLHYNGKAVDIPINHEYEHGFSCTILNDAQGYIYSALTNFIMSEATNLMANSGYTMTVKAYTGDEKHYSGALMTLRGVRIETVSGLSWGQDDNAVQTFTLAGKFIDFTYTPGALADAAGWIGAANSLLR